MVLVDARGSGKSSAIDCTQLQSSVLVSQSDMTACGAQLGDTSDLFGSNLAADDMAAILGVLGISQIDLYGDSYGTFSARFFAGLHGDSVRTIVLDASYSPLSKDPWYTPRLQACGRPSTTCAIAHPTAQERRSTDPNLPRPPSARALARQPRSCVERRRGPWPRRTSASS